jgi:glycosyltransferase involved in cell wall biosynthesis
MKILFVAPGDSLHTSRWISRIANREIECIFYDMTGIEKMHPMGEVKVLRLEDSVAKKHEAWKNIGALGHILANVKSSNEHYRFLQKVVDQEKPDLIHLHWLFHSVSLAASRISGVPLISTPWGSDLLTPEYKIKANFFDLLKHRYVVRKVVKNSNAFCCDAPHMKESLVEFGASESKIDIIYFGTDTATFSPEQKSDSLWNSLGLRSNTIKVVSNRVLADMYDIETFIRAAKSVLKLNSEIDFIIVGGGPSTEKLKSYARELGIRQNLTFTGRLDDETFASATNSADIYVSTSPTDGGIAASVAEAMSAGVPVLITNFGDNPKWLRGESAGYLFEPGDDISLAQLILRLAADKELRESMGQVGRAVILSENNAQIETTKVINLYKRIIGDFSNYN